MTSTNSTESSEAGMVFRFVLHCSQGIVHLHFYDDYLVSGCPGEGKWPWIRQLLFAHGGVLQNGHPQRSQELVQWVSLQEELGRDRGRPGVHIISLHFTSYCYCCLNKNKSCCNQLSKCKFCKDFRGNGEQ